jgi:hypothetical protein
MWLGPSLGVGPNIISKKNHALVRYQTMLVTQDDHFSIIRYGTDKINISKKTLVGRNYLPLIG